jgi:DNA-binding transcriptional MerR regulator
MRNTGPTAEIPDKMYFKVGEASAVVGVPAYVLRFWETEFSCIHPKRTPSGQRLYRRKDVELLLEIKHLLYDRKFTIPGARQRLQDRAVAPAPSGERLSEIRRELQALRALLEEPASDGRRRIP